MEICFLWWREEGEGEGGGTSLHVYTRKNTSVLNNRILVYHMIVDIRPFSSSSSWQKSFDITFFFVLFPPTEVRWTGEHGHSKNFHRINWQHCKFKSDINSICFIANLRFVKYLLCQRQLVSVDHSVASSNQYWHSSITTIMSNIDRHLLSTQQIPLLEHL